MISLWTSIRVVTTSALDNQNCIFYFLFFKFNISPLFSTLDKNVSLHLIRDTVSVMLSDLPLGFLGLKVINPDNLYAPAVEMHKSHQVFL